MRVFAFRLRQFDQQGARCRRARSCTDGRRPTGRSFRPVSQPVWAARPGVARAVDPQSRAPRTRSGSGRQPPADRARPSGWRRCAGACAAGLGPGKLYPGVVSLFMARAYSMLSTAPCCRCAASRSPSTNARYLCRTVKSAWPMSLCRLKMSMPLRRLHRANDRRNVWRVDVLDARTLSQAQEQVF